MVGCTLVSVGSLGAAVVISSPTASLACYAAMVVSGIAVVVLHLASARAYDPYRESEKES
jgi:hypothetical protein